MWSTEKLRVPGTRTTLTAVTYDSGVAGNFVFSTGAIHGNETCGPTAINQLMHNLQLEQIVERGKFISIPVCNPLAFSQGRRFSAGGINLNRIFQYHAHPQCEEEFVANALKSYVDNLVATEGTNGAWIDLHSSHNAGDVPCIILDHDTPANRALAAALKFPMTLSGWTEMYSNPDGSIAEPCTINYGHAKGLRGFTVECGGHNDATAPDMAKQALLAAMAHEGLTEQAPYLNGATPRFLRFAGKPVYRPAGPGFLVNNWRNGSQVKAGTPIAFYGDKPSRELRYMVAGEDCTILIPNHKATEPDPHNGTQAEWFYIGTPEETQPMLG